MTGGGSGGGSSGGGAGTVDAGDGIWDFASVTVSPTPAASGGIVGFAETDAGLLAMSGSGRLYLSTGGAFLEVRSFPGIQPLDFEGTPSGHLFFLTTVDVFDCASNCADGGAWTQGTVNPNGRALETLCVVDDANVMAVGTEGSFGAGMYFPWNGTIAATSIPLGVDSPGNCWRGATGDLFFPAEGEVLRYAPLTSDITHEIVGPLATTLWRGGGSTPGHEWVARPGPVLLERGSGGWTDAGVLGTGVEFISVFVGVSPTLAFAFGGGGTADGQCGYRFNGTSWARMTPDVPAIDRARASLRASNGTLFVGGTDSNGGPAILRGTRR